MANSDRRANTRVDTDFEINYIHDNDYLVSFTKNISVEGMFIYTENPPSIGEIVQLSFSIENIDKATVSAKVIWVNSLESENDPGIGVKFIDPPEELKEAILKKVSRIAVLENKEEK